MTAIDLFTYAVHGDGQVDMPEYPLEEDGETIDMLVVTAVYRAKGSPGPVAHLIARMYVMAAGGTEAQKDTAERFVRKATGITA